MSFKKVLVFLLVTFSIGAQSSELVFNCLEFDEQGGLGVRVEKVSDHYLLSFYETDSEGEFVYHEAISNKASCEGEAGCIDKFVSEDGFDFATVYLTGYVVTRRHGTMFDSWADCAIY